MNETDRFLGFESAELVQARGLPTEEAKAIFDRYLSEDRWRCEPLKWILLAQNLEAREGSGVTKLATVEMWLDHVVDHSIGTAHQELIPYLWGWVINRSTGDDERRQAVLTKFVAWLVDKAGVGHAETLAQVLSHALSPHEPYVALRSRIIPLMRVLMHLGASELRMRRNARLMVRILERFREQRDTSIVSAVEIHLAADHGVDVWNEVHYPRGPWPVIETALEFELAESRVVDVALRLIRSQAPHLAWVPFWTPDLPLSRKALLSTLTNGTMPLDASENGWRLYVWCHRPSDLRHELSLRTLAPCCKAIEWCLTSKDRGAWELVSPDHRLVYNPQGVAEWASFAVRETLRLAGTVDSNGARQTVVDHIFPIIAWRSHTDIPANRAIVEPLAEWMGKSGKPDRAVELALWVLGRVPDPYYAATAAVECLRKGGAATVEVNSPERGLAQLKTEIERFISLPWFDTLFGVDVGLLLRGRFRVDFQTLEADAKVQLDGDVVRIDPGYYTSVIRQFGVDDDDVMALCLLYFAHELIHLQQGVGDYAAVQELRVAGSEMVLMHLDLTADHVATLMIHRSHQRWKINWLKQLVFKSLESFPASTFHTHAARYRKAARLVSCRLDLLARQRGLMPATVENDYLFTDYSPAGGPMFVLAYGPPIRALGRVALNENDAKILGNAADPHDDPSAYLQSLDAILNRALDSGTWK